MLSMKRRRVSLSEQVRQAIDRAGMTRYAIWRQTGIAQATLSKFMLGQRGLPMKTLDKLADFLDLNIVPGSRYPPVVTKPPRSRGKTKAAPMETSTSKTRQRGRKAQSKGR